jgi:hypothetical protein
MVHAHCADGRWVMNKGKKKKKRAFKARQAGTTIKAKGAT